MTYTVLILRRARKELGQLSPDARTRVIAAVRGLGNTPRPHGAVRLQGRAGWRVRVGDYRVLYQIDDDKRMITVTVVRHRRDAYR